MSRQNAIIDKPAFLEVFGDQLLGKLGWGSFTRHIGGTMKGKRSKFAMVEALESRRLLAAFLSMGQQSEVTRNPPVALGAAPNPQIHEHEMMSAVNPRNPMNMAVFTGVSDYTGNAPTLYMRLYWTVNGGASWSSQNFYDGWTDPGLAYAADGNLFISGGTGVRH